MPNFYMLVGVPGSGKSSYLKERLLRNEDERDAAIISSDHTVMYRDLDDAIKWGDDIFWDQTNLSYGSRKGKLNKIPDSYTKVALVFNTPDDDELERRLNSREGKHIPKKVIKDMAGRYQPPTIPEGFNRVEFYQTNFSNPNASFEERFFLNYVES